MSINSNYNFTTPSFLQTEEGKKKALTICAPALITSGAVLIGTNKPQGVEKNILKASTRIKRSAAAGLITAGVMAVITLFDKEKIQNGIENIKGLFRKKESTQEETRPDGTEITAENFKTTNETLAESDINQTPASQNLNPIMEAQNLIDEPLPNFASPNNDKLQQNVLQQA